MREKEIALSLRRRPAGLDSHGDPRIRIPKRLRGVASLISRMLRRHSRCAYVELLRYHCSVKVEYLFV